MGSPTIVTAERLENKRAITANVGRTVSKRKRGSLFGSSKAQASLGEVKDQSQDWPNAIGITYSSNSTRMLPLRFSFTLLGCFQTMSGVHYIVSALEDTKSKQIPKAHFQLTIGLMDFHRYIVSTSQTPGPSLTTPVTRVILSLRNTAGKEA